jgi:TIR domain-containing protein
MEFKAFISYSHAADGQLAPALQAGLQQFGKAWYQIRSMRVFRDEAVLSANPALWSSIEHALEESEYFLLLASPSAAHSVWIEREVAWWLAHRNAERILILVTEGEVLWDQRMNDFDWARTNALPAQLAHRFAEEPLYLDLRWARGRDHLSIRHLRFRGAVLDIVATLMGRDKDELDGEEIRQHRHTMRLAWGGVVSLCVLTLLLIGATSFAFAQRSEAIRQKDNAELARLDTQSAYDELQKRYAELSAIRKEEHEKAIVPIPKIR